MEVKCLLKRLLKSAQIIFKNNFSKNFHKNKKVQCPSNEMKNLK